MTAADDQAQLAPELLGRLAAQLRLPLGPDRAAELAGRVQDTFSFTSELDQLDLDGAVPATVFVPLGG